jgi:hypothetical protein
MSTNCNRIGLVMTLAVALLAQRSAARPSYCVSSSDGDDAAAGDAGAPWKTLQRAAGALRAGDTVVVRPGEYAGFVIGWDGTAPSGTESAPIRFMAERGAKIVSRNTKTPDGINLEGASYVVIDGFTLTNADKSISRASIRATNGNHITIVNNSIDGAGRWGICSSHIDDLLIENNRTTGSIKEHGIYVSNACQRPIVRSNRVWGNRQCGIHMNGDASQGGDGMIRGATVEGNVIFDNGRGGGAAINADGVIDSIFRRNVLYDNHANGIALFREDGAAGSSNNRVINNTVLMAADARWAVTIRGASTGNLIENNILCSLSARRGSINLAPDSAAGTVSDYNVVTDRFSDDDDIFSLARWRKLNRQDAHSLIATPQQLFVDADGGDFALADGSPAIGAGRDGQDIGATAPRPGAQRKAVAATSSHALILAAAGVIAAIGSVVLAASRRSLHRWLPSYVLSAPKRLRRRSSRPVHVLICIADHFEPGNGRASDQQAMRRVDQWVARYPERFAPFRDSDGRPPQHTFFYPIEQYNADHLDALAGLCRDGFGEVEVHLHHDHDTEANLRQTLLRAKQVLAMRHGLLSRYRETGQIAYGFVHGNWALCNSRPDGEWCGVNNELAVLRETGCYADFTLPSAPSPTQTPKINSIYYACDDPRRPRSHDRGIDVGAGRQPPDSLMLIQGPLCLNWRRRRWGIVPRIENACIQSNQPPTMERLDRWIRARVQVANRPDWFFVKLHTHGAPEANQRVLLGEPMVQFHRALAARAVADDDFHFHYVTARQMYNLARAAESGWRGDVEGVRDFELLSCGAWSTYAGRAEGTVCPGHAPCTDVSRGADFCEILAAAAPDR